MAFMCAEIDPETACPGMLRADRFRHRPGARTRAWRCDVCKQRYFRCLFTNRILRGHNTDARERARRIEEHRNHAD